MPRATIDDVARQAGVTKSTVSHALSGKRPVSPETRRRIENAIAELGYRPNPVAQRLAAGRTGAVGLVYEVRRGRLRCEDTAVLAAVSASLSAAGFATVLFAQSGEGADQIQPFLESGMLDGLILGQVQAHDERVTALRSAGLPFVMLGRTADNSGLNLVDVDIEGAVELCVEHLVGLGHRRIAFLHEDAGASAAAGRALQAYERAAARRRLRLVAPPCPASSGALRLATRALLQGQPDITALITPGEVTAWTVAQVGIEMGRRVPEDLSLVCLAKTTVADLFTPVVTGVDLQPGQQAEQAVAVLVELLAQPSPTDRQLLLEPRWVDGQTTGPL